MQNRQTTDIIDDYVSYIVGWRFPESKIIDYMDIWVFKDTSANGAPKAIRVSADFSREFDYDNSLDQLGSFKKNLFLGQVNTGYLPYPSITAIQMAQLFVERICKVQKLEPGSLDYVIDALKAAIKHVEEKSLASKPTILNKIR